MNVQENIFLVTLIHERLSFSYTMNTFLSSVLSYLLWLQNSGYIYSGIIIHVNVAEKYSKSSFTIRRWQRYCLHSIAPFRSSLYEMWPKSIRLAFILVSSRHSAQLAPAGYEHNQ